MKTNTKQNVENQVVNTINAKNTDKNQATTTTTKNTDKSQSTERDLLKNILRGNVSKIISDESRYADTRRLKLSKKLSSQKEKGSLIMHQAANGLRLDNLSGSTSVADAIGTMIRICNNIDKGRCPELKQILDNYGIAVASLKAYIRLSNASDYNRFLTKSGQIDYTRAIGRICQDIMRERKQ